LAFTLHRAPQTLASFDTVDFTNCTFDSRPISDFDWNQIDMVPAREVIGTAGRQIRRLTHAGVTDDLCGGDGRDVKGEIALRPPRHRKVSSLETEHVPLAGGICCCNTFDAC
jgi:hypothetical protein